MGAAPARRIEGRGGSTRGCRDEALDLTEVPSIVPERAQLAGDGRSGGGGVAIRTASLNANGAWHWTEPTWAPGAGKQAHQKREGRKPATFPVHGYC